MSNLSCRVDGNAICIGSNKEINKPLPEQRFVIWKELSEEEMGILLMSLQEEDE